MLEGPKDTLAETSTQGEACGFCARADHPDSACPKQQRFAEVAQQRVADSAAVLESLEVRLTLCRLRGALHRRGTYCARMAVAVWVAVWTVVRVEV